MAGTLLFLQTMRAETRRPGQRSRLDRMWLTTLEHELRCGIFGWIISAKVFVGRFAGH